MFSKRFIISFLAVILVSSPVSLSVQALPLAQDTGGMDLDGYCKHLGYSDARLDPTQKNVNGWGCLRPDGIQVGMDLYDLCNWQYGNSFPIPKYSDYNDPYSWYCSATESGLPTPQQTRSDNSEVTGLCLNVNYEELALEVGNGLTIFISGGGVLRESPSFSAEVIKILPEQDVYAPYIDGPRCSYDTEGSSSDIIWWKVNVDGVVGWNSDQDTAYISNIPSITDSGQNTPQAQPNSSAETWSTSISQCGVNPLLYEFYKDEENILKLVLVNPSGFFGLIQNVLAHIGFWIDLGKIKFEPTAEEVYVTLRYSNLGDYEAQVDRYLQGKLLSSDIYPLDEATYLDYQNRLGACGIIT